MFQKKSPIPPRIPPLPGNNRKHLHSNHRAQCWWWALAEHPAGNADAALGYYDIAVNTLNIGNHFHTDKIALLTTYAWVRAT
jgi:hypothetical protein